MSRICILLCVWAWVGLVGGAVAQVCPTEDIHAGVTGCIHSRVNTHTAHTRRTAVSEAVGQMYDLRFAHLRLGVDLTNGYLNGDVRLQLTLTQPSDSLTIGLSDTLTVAAVQWAGVAVPFFRTGYTLTARLPGVVPAGGADTLRIVYAGRPRNLSFGCFRLEQHESGPVLWTLSEPYHAQDWWPTKQTLNDKLDSVWISVVCDTAYRVAANGLRVAETFPTPTTRLTEWRHGYAIPAYLVAFAVAPYLDRDTTIALPGGSGLYIQDFFLPGDEANQQRWFTRLDYVQLFDSLFAPYPFRAEKYGCARVLLGGGMEHTTMSFNGDYSGVLYVHELAHQWFGNYITCGSWADLWLNESFATFCTTIYYEQIENGFYRDIWYRDIQNRIIAQGVDGSVYATDTANVGNLFSGTLRYYKGAWVLAQLRYMLGDEMFYQSIRNYLADTTLAYGYATTQDLQRNLEAATGRSLQRYFDDWIYAESYPNYTYSYRNLPGGRLGIHLAQTAANASGHVFAQPIECVAYSRWPNDSLRTDTIRIEVTEAATYAEFPTGFWVDSLAFNRRRFSVAGAFTHAPDLGGDCPDCGLHFSPNPATQGIWLSSPHPQRGSTGIRLVDAAGRTVYTRQWSQSPRQWVPLETLAPATYGIWAEQNGQWLWLGKLVWQP